MVRHQGRNIYQFFSQGLRSALPLTRPRPRPRPRSAAVHLAGHFSEAGGRVAP